MNICREHCFSRTRKRRSLWCIMEKMKTASTWKTALNLQWNQLIAEINTSPRIAIVGIGNPYRSDDAAGILIARELSQREFAADREHFLICEAGHAPENVTGGLRKFAPSLVLLIDAAEMDKEPGIVEWIREEEDRKSTRLNSSQGHLSYAVFC